MRDALYQQVYDRLLEDIRSGRHPVGSRLPAEAELLEEHEVSAITLKRALDLLRDQGYIDRKPRRGTFVISDVGDEPGHTATSGVPLIGAVVTNFDDTFGSHIIGALLDPDSGANVILKRSLGDQSLEERLIRELIASDVKGLILEPGSSAYVPPAILELIMQRFPVVILDRVFDGVPVSSVVSDNVGAARDATAHLIALGHKQLGLVTSTSRVTTSEDRREGFLHAHAAAHIPYSVENEYRHVESTVPGSHVRAEEDVERLRQYVREHPALTGFVATEFNIAVLVRSALELEGRAVPDDASIVSFDQADAFYAPATFRFTHIEQDQTAMGRETIRLVLEQLRGDGEVRKVLLPTKLVEGQSARSPRRARQAAASA